MPYSVVDYSPESLLDVLAEGSHEGRRPDPERPALLNNAKQNDAKGRIAQKWQYRFLLGYFEKTNPVRIVVEKNYVDHDFLEDYAAYYSRCFQGFERFCRRLHFFSNPFEQKDLDAALNGGASAPLIATMKESYLGFVVVRPLPHRVIGRTCLTTYPDEPGITRAFPACRPYRVNLFGIELEVTSVAFQEQDREVAACATAALWSLFQTTGVVFQHSIPSPVEITRAATATEEDASRSFPNDGLSPRQQAAAIRSIGLEPLLIGMPAESVERKWDYLRAVTYAYSGLGLPVLVSSEMQRVPEGSVDAAEAQPIGFHAVTAVGYRMEVDDATSIDDDGPHLTATRLSRIFVHDDQAGPFAKLSFDQNWIRTSKPKDTDGTVMVADPRHVIVPLYHKIRIPFRNVYQAVSEFDVLYRSSIAYLQHQWAMPSHPLLDSRLEWDIRLEDVRSLKARYLEELSDQGLHAKAALAGLLTRNMPKYLWRCVASAAKRCLCEVLFDATGLVQGSFFFDAFARHRLLDAVSAGALLPAALDNVRKSPDSLAILRKIHDHQV